MLYLDQMDINIVLLNRPDDLYSFFSDFDICSRSKKDLKIKLPRTNKQHFYDWIYEDEYATYSDYA